MNNIFKFALGILSTLVFAWLAFVVGARAQFGDLEPTSSTLNEDGSIPEDADLYPKHFLELLNKEQRVCLSWMQLVIPNRFVL